VSSAVCVVSYALPVIDKVLFVPSETSIEKDTSDKVSERFGAAFNLTDKVPSNDLKIVSATVGYTSEPQTNSTSQLAFKLNSRTLSWFEPTVIVASSSIASVPGAGVELGGVAVFPLTSREKLITSAFLPDKLRDVKTPSTAFPAPPTVTLVIAECVIAVLIVVVESSIPAIEAVANFFRSRYYCVMWQTFICLRLKLIRKARAGVQTSKSVHVLVVHIWHFNSPPRNN